ncbi:MAG: S1 RNA-binding domain-containing protein [Chloroflexota bacterium]|nr:S1 RNA-binding domain-containing protein [Chloroflexota bacterium]
MAEVAQTLDIGMEVTGRVKHVGIYGALVDIGTGQDALLHISQLSNGEERRFEEVVPAGSDITAYVYKTRQDGYVALSMEKPPMVPWQSIKQGNTYTGEVIRVENFGVFVDFGAERPGMVHVSEMADGYVKSPSDIASIGQEVEVRVIKKSGRPRQIDLTMKKDQEESMLIEEEAEDEVEVPTSMAQAFRRAMGGREENEVRNDSKRSPRIDHRSRQEEILARTLRGS